MTGSASVDLREYAISASPNAVTVSTGSSGTSTISVTPFNGFNSNVMMSVGGLPSGVVATFHPGDVTSTTTVTFTVSPAAAPGTYPVTITGKIVSGSTRTANIDLTVTP